MAARLLVAITALLCALGVPTAAVAADGPAWTVSPAPGGERPYLYAEGAPGSVLEDTFTVTNPGAKPLTAELRPTAAGAWIALAGSRITVPPRTRAKVPFTLTVPPDAPPGDLRATIVASSGGREQSVRVQLRVSGPRLPALTVEDVSYAKGAIRWTLVNRGNTTLTPRVTITADGLFGELLRRSRAAAELPPAGRVTLTEKWQRTPALDAAEIRVEANAAGDVRARGTASVRFVPWPWLAAALAVLAAAVASALRRRRTLHRRRAAPSEQPTGERHLARSGR